MPRTRVGPLRTGILAAMLSAAATGLACADTCSVGLPAQQLTPLPDLTGTYKGFTGLLYSGSNTPPADHDQDGRDFAGFIVPRDTAGNPDAVNGKIVFLALGFSNATIEFCGGASFYDLDDQKDDPAATACRPPAPLRPTPCTLPDCPYNQVESFMGRAFTESRSIPHDGKIVLVDGAKGGQTLDAWDPSVLTNGCTQIPCTYNYDRVRAILSGAGLSEAQVQGIWFKSADAGPTVALPDPAADAYYAETRLGDIMRAIRLRYPKARQVFLSPRIYGGYANVAGNHLNPEPYAYELGFSIKWLIDAQIREMRGAPTDPVAGDLRYHVPSGSAPSTWIDWGPYLWSDGHACKDGYACLPGDLRGTAQNGTPDECTHPSTYGEAKVGQQLLDFVNGSAYAGWFRAH